MRRGFLDKRSCIETTFKLKYEKEQEVIYFLACASASLYHAAHTIWEGGWGYGRKGSRDLNPHSLQSSNLFMCNWFHSFWPHSSNTPKLRTIFYKTKSFKNGFRTFRKWPPASAAAKIEHWTATIVLVKRRLLTALNRVFQMQNPLILEKCPQGTASAEKKKAAFEEASSSIENDESIGFIHTTYLTSKQKNLDVFCYVFFFSSFCCLKDFFFSFLSFI